MMKSILLLLLVSLSVSVGSAVVMDAFTGSGVVKSFNKTSVTMVVQERVVEIPRSAITDGKLQSGETVKFSLNGKQVSQIFFSSKTPASTPSK